MKKIILGISIFLAHIFVLLITIAICCFTNKTSHITKFDASKIPENAEHLRFCKINYEYDYTFEGYDDYKFNGTNVYYYDNGKFIPVTDPQGENYWNTLTSED